MSKTRLWWFKFGISGFYSDINEDWDEANVVHRVCTDWKKLSPYQLLIEHCSADLELGSDFMCVVLAC